MMGNGDNTVLYWVLFVGIALLLLLMYGLGFFSIAGNLPTFNQDVQNITLGQPEMITWSIGPNSYGGLDGAGGEIDVYYNIVSVQIDGSTVLSYEQNNAKDCQGNLGYDCYHIEETWANSATLTTVKSMPNGGGTYFHCSGTAMCDAVHQNIAGQPFSYPKEAVYTLTINGLSAGIHTVTTIMQGNEQIHQVTTGSWCGGAAKTLTDTFTVTGSGQQGCNPACGSGYTCNANTNKCVITSVPRPPEPEVNVLSLSSVINYIKYYLCQHLGAFC